MGSSTSVKSTGPTSTSNTSVASLRKRLETLETSVKRLNANRQTPSLLVHQLGNTLPMSVVKDGQTLVYNEASGQYEPGASTYASLQGPGADTSGDELTQTGGFNVVLGDVLVDGTQDFTVTATGHTGQPVAFQNIFSGSAGGAQWAALVGNATKQGSIVLGIGATGDSSLFIRADTISFTDGLGGTTGAIEFFGAGGASIQTVTGSRGGNAALASLLAALHAYGLIIDSSTP
jgi:hypothetical protein